MLKCGRSERFEPGDRLGIFFKVEEAKSETLIP